MAFVSSFIYCDTVQPQITPAGLQYQILNPLQVLSPVAIPGNFSFSIACNISDFAIEQNHSVEISFKDPKGNLIGNPIKVEFGVEQLDQTKGKVNGLQVNLDMRNVVLKEEGVYTTEVAFDHVVIGEYKIRAIIQEPK